MLPLAEDLLEVRPQDRVLVARCELRCGVLDRKLLQLIDVDSRFFTISRTTFAMFVLLSCRWVMARRASWIRTRHNARR